MKNISEEIHDNIGQILSLVRININRIKGADLQKVQEHANNSSELVGKAIQDLRNLTRTLNTDYIVRADLVSLIAMELERVKRTGRYETRLEQQGDPYKLPHHLVLFRIFQESVNNVLKHADATKLSVAVCFLPQQFELHICDNGKGFDPVLVMQEPQSGLGIQSIKNRAHLIGATCRIESGPDGTAVRVVLPVSL